MCVQSPELVTEIRLKRKYLCLVREENIWSICQFKTCQAPEEHHSVTRSDTVTLTLDDDTDEYSLFCIETLQASEENQLLISYCLQRFVKNCEIF